jgi:hypothetical protein
MRELSEARELFFLKRRRLPMMEVLSGYPPDVFAAVWRDALKGESPRGPMPISERDKLAGKHDVRILAKYARGAKPVTSVELAEQGMLGVGQWRDFGRIAIITDDRSMRAAVQFFSPFFHGPTRVFSNAEAEQARLWIDHHDHH